MITTEGALSYSEVAERLAVNIARCLDALLNNTAETIQITPECICSIHRQIAGELFPDWAGRFRNTDVQVGTHLPPIDPAATGESGKITYFNALRAADAGNLAPLSNLWLERLLK